ncbi:hypothetical protein PGH47_23960 [Streptomyces sp. HUAS 31]|uniref:hypothetical protein n=1 Tax=Streptomyces sp. HUAS 31 TaxID=3020055 RepID=UPI002305F4DE|nr:hypothetical protein [Streptomyces sp. HUAS 31]WCD98551.1 hypothetical protein PGH47_23960 [Streptomyces sp. HUAS 31]
MPRGRHRHSPPLHRMLPPSAIAGVSVVCALAPWVFSQTMALRGFAAAAAATAVVGAVVMRRWDTHAGKQVADLTRARASDEWRHEERVAELEADLDESRELRVKLEQRLRGKRAELAGLRNEHASLLRRYATAETERATVLEERRVLEIEAAAPARALPPVPEPGDGEGEAADDAAAEFAGTAEEAGAVAAPAEAEGVDGTDGTESVAVDDAAEAIQDDEDDEDDEVTEAAEEAPVDAKVFSPEGSRLFLRAKAALARFDKDGEPEADGEVRDEASDEDSLEETSAEETFAEETFAEDESQSPVAESSVDEVPLGEVSEDESAADRSATEDESVKAKAAKDSVESKDSVDSKEEPSKDGSPKNDPPKGDGPSGGRPLKDASGDAEVEGAGASETEPVLEDDPQGKPGAVDGHEHAAAVTPAGALATTRPALPAARRPAGHFIEPTAVAVAPAAPVRRPAVEGGFDFFGTKQGTEPSALESVQNEDLADVVGQEALALHKAESEAEFKPADEESRGIGQVIDLTAHDETEQIDIQGLRSAVS